MSEETQVEQAQAESTRLEPARGGGMLQRRVTILLGLLIAVVIAAALFSSGSVVPERAVLVVELSGSYPDAPSDDLLSRIQGEGTALPTLTLQLRKARKDDRIQGVLLHIRGLSLGSAQRRELHDAVRDLRESGVKVVALLDFAGIGASQELYVASAADQVYVVPGFMGPLTGIAGEFTLLGGMAEQLGVTIEYERIGAYKAAPESLAARELSEPAREMYTELLDGLYADLVAVIGAGRGMEEKAVRELVDRAPGTADEWVEAGLADGIAGREDVLEAAGFGDLEEISASSYLRVDPSELGLRTGPKIALIFGEGTIVPGGGGSSNFSADRVSGALRDAAERDDFRAIVLRINSGGGSALASEQIWRAVRDARKKKPVVVSMSDAAASGGYYVASAANAVVAQPTTQTGSIGVFFLRPSLGGLFEKLGIQTELMQRGALSGLGASGEKLSEGQRGLLRQLVRAIYDGFLDRVAEGRDMPREEVDEVAQGRVWLGSRALELGLVDELGGLDTAVRLAQAESGIDADEDPQRVIFPEPRALGDQIRDLLSGGGLRSAALDQWLTRLPAPWRGLPELGAGPAMLYPFWIELD